MLKIKLIVFFLVAVVFGNNEMEAQIIIEPPIIDSISVDTAPNGTYHCVLGWELYDWTGYDIDSSGFIVRDVIPGSGYANPDTINDATATFYMDFSSDPANDIQGYGLVAFTIVDGEFLKSKIEDQFSRNFRLRVLTYDSCLAIVKLFWNDYYSDEAPSGILEPEYTIKAISESDFLTASATGNSYTFQNLKREETYWFRLSAETVDFTSSSNPVTKKITTPANPGKPYIESLHTSHSFSNTGTIKLDEQVTNHIELMSSQQIYGNYDTVSTYDNVQNENLTYSDVGVGENIIYYYVAAYNACGLNSVRSDTLNSIVLAARDNEDYIRLEANGLKKADATYNLYREVEETVDVFDPGPIPMVYDDYSIFELTLNDSKVKYYIEANVGDSITVRSNPVEIEILDDLLWPNAIIAGEPGMDGVFKAIPQRSLPESFNLKIYNKWGELIFETDDINTGWRGRYKGDFVMSGGYLYVARYRFPGKKEKVVRGTVTVIH